MSMTIGRASLSTDPRSITQSGDTLTFTIDIYPGTLAASKAIRQQLLGLVPGEVIPMTWDGDTDFDGFYIVGGVTVSPELVYLQNGFMRAGVTATRVRGGYGNSLVELVDSGWDRATGATSTTNNPRVPSNISYSGSALNESRETATGTIYVLGGTNTTNLIQVEPADFYNGACTIEYQQGGTWYTAVGKQIPDDVPLRIGNGLIRLSWDGSDLDLEVYEGATDSAWQAVDAITFPTGDGNGAAVNSALILRNDPEALSVTWPISLPEASGEPRYTPVTFSMNRGEYVTSVVSPLQSIVIDATTTHDPTEVQINSVDRGWRANAANADGHVWLLLTFDGAIGTSGNISLSVGDVGFISVNPDTTAIGEGDALAEVRYATSQRQRVIT